MWLGRQGGGRGSPPRRPPVAPTLIAAASHDGLDERSRASGVIYHRPLRSRSLNRRTVLRLAARASVGAASLALVGCSDGDDERVRQRELHEAKQRAARAAEREAAEARERLGVQADDDGDAIPATNRAEQGAMAGIIDPLDWRMRYHWSRLAALPGQRSGPVWGGQVHVEAPPPLSWTPFVDLAHRARAHNA